MCDYTDSRRHASNNNSDRIDNDGDAPAGNHNRAGAGGFNDHNEQYDDDNEQYNDHDEQHDDQQYSGIAGSQHDYDDYDASSSQFV